MQDRYVGDIGDFGKYGLLRWLCGLTDGSAKNTTLTLGIAWYWTPSSIDERLCSRGTEQLPNDGKHVEYLSPRTAIHKHLQRCDSHLHEQLGVLVANDRRNIHAVQHLPIWPTRTKFHIKNVSCDSDAGEKSVVHVRDRRTAREIWLRKTRQGIEDADIVFLDPNNGIQPESLSPRSRAAGKYALKDEIRDLYESGKHSLVIYHHLGRSKSHSEQIEIQRKRLVSVLKPKSHIVSVFPAWYRRGTSRVFFIVPRPKHVSRLSASLKRFTGSRWCERNHFDQSLLSASL